jgi:hypothetical protein
MNHELSNKIPTVTTSSIVKTASKPAMSTEQKKDFNELNTLVTLQQDRPVLSSRHVNVSIITDPIINRHICIDPPLNGQELIPNTPDKKVTSY